MSVSLPSKIISDNRYEEVMARLGRSLSGHGAGSFALAIPESEDTLEIRRGLETPARNWATA